MLSSPHASVTAVAAVEIVEEGATPLASASSLPSPPGGASPISTEFALLSQQIAHVDKKIDHRLEHYAPVKWVDQLVKAIQESQRQMRMCVDEIKSSQQAQTAAQQQSAQIAERQQEAIEGLVSLVGDVVLEGKNNANELSALKLQHENERHEQALQAEKRRADLLEQQVVNGSWGKRLQSAALHATSITAILIFLGVLAKILSALLPHLHHILEALTHVSG